MQKERQLRFLLRSLPPTGVEKNSVLPSHARHNHVKLSEWNLKIDAKTTSRPMNARATVGVRIGARGNTTMASRRRITFTSTTVTATTTARARITSKVSKTRRQACVFASMSELSKTKEGHLRPTKNRDA